MNAKETLGEIIAVASLLIKFGFDSVLENQALFIQYLNELKIQINGKPVDKVKLENLTLDVTTKEKRELIDEFNASHKSIYTLLELYNNHRHLALPSTLPT